MGCFLVAQGKLLLAYQALTYLLTDCPLKVAVLEPVPEDRAEFLHAILHGVARVEAEGCAHTPLYPLCPSTPLASAHIPSPSHTHLTPLTPLTNPHTPLIPHTGQRYLPIPPPGTRRSLRWAPRPFGACSPAAAAPTTRSGWRCARRCWVCPHPHPQPNPHPHPAHAPRTPNPHLSPTLALAPALTRPYPNPTPKQVCPRAALPTRMRPMARRCSLPPSPVPSSR